MDKINWDLINSLFPEERKKNAGLPDNKEQKETKKRSKYVDNSPIAVFNRRYKYGTKEQFLNEQINPFWSGTIQRVQKEYFSKWWDENIKSIRKQSYTIFNEKNTSHYQVIALKRGNPRGKTEKTRNDREYSFQKTTSANFAWEIFNGEYDKKTWDEIKIIKFPVENSNKAEIVFDYVKNT